MSQTAISILDLPVTATAAITEYRGVDFNGAQATVAGQKILGIARRSAPIGLPVDLTVQGTATCEAGGAFAKGAALAMDAAGRVVAASALAAAVGTLQVGVGGTAVTSTAANGAIITGAPALSGGDLPQFIVGYAMEAAAAAGDKVEVLLR